MSKGGVDRVKIVDPETNLDYHWKMNKKGPV